MGVGDTDDLLDFLSFGNGKELVDGCLNYFKGIVRGKKL
jgi:hypothetical protein